jgi:hypothetical protein
MRTFLLLTTLIALIGCASPQPTIDYDPSQNFSKYRTFAFINEHPLLLDEGLPGISPLLEGRLVQITENILTEQGYQRVAERGEADFVVSFTLGGRDKISVTNYPEHYRSYYNNWGWGGRYYGHSEVDVRQYTEGTLAVDFYDVEGRKPVWHGVSTRKITSKMRKNPGETVREILGQIYGRFPPR